jgi:membrane associated rhomboid family serine protease
VVIPFHDVNPVRRTPWATYLLIGLNAVAFLLTPAATTTGVQQVGLAELCELEAFYDRYAAIPEEMLDNRQRPEAVTGEVGVGERGPGCVVDEPDYRKNPALSVLYSMFLHAGWLHLLGNMLFLWVFGNNVEDRFGRVRFLLFYLLCGYASAYGFALADPDSTVPLVGASGAVSGVLGAYLVLYPRARVWSLVPVVFFLPMRLPAWLVLGTWFVIQWLYSAGYAVSGGGSVAYLAHVLGFVVGALVALPAARRGRRPAYRRRRPMPPGWRSPPGPGR